VKSDQGTKISNPLQCTGIVGNNPIIVAVNGEGHEAEMHIIEVNYSRPGAEFSGWVVCIIHSFTQVVL
jgi:hypothetical protein